MNWKFWRQAEAEEKVTATAVLALVTRLEARIDALRTDIGKGIDVGTASSFRQMEARIDNQIGSMNQRLAALQKSGLDITSISAFRRLEVAIKQLQPRRVAKKRP